MTDAVHRNVSRVVEAGAAIGLDVVPVRFPEGTKTAVDAANAIGCDVGQIVKSLIFAVDGEVVLAYVSGATQLDESKLPYWMTIARELSWSLGSCEVASEKWPV